MADETTTAATTDTATTTATETTPDWRAGIPEDLRADPSLATFKDVGGLAKAYRDTKAMVGAGPLKAPADDAPDEEWGAYYAKLGRPESPDKYGFEAPKLPEGMGEIDPEGLSGFRKEAHAAGLTDRQAGRLMNWYATYHMGTVDKLTAQTGADKAKVMAELKSEWGPAYDRNVRLARQAVKDLFEDDAAMAAAVEDAGNHVPWLKGLHRIGERMLEHGEITANLPAGETLEDVQARMDKMREDPDPQNWPKAKRDEWESLVIRADRLQQRRRT